jgi:transcriptional regulator
VDDLDVSLMRGTLDLLILKALAWGPRHGYAVAEWIGQVTDDRLLVGEGTLYPALHRLERQRLVEATWGLSDNNRRARYYQLSTAGRRRLVSGTSSWQRFVEAAGRALRVTTPEVVR